MANGRPLPTAADRTATWLPIEPYRTPPGQTPESEPLVGHAHAGATRGADDARGRRHGGEPERAHGDGEQDDAEGRHGEGNERGSDDLRAAQMPVWPMSQIESALRVEVVVEATASNVDEPGSMGPHIPVASAATKAS